MTDASTGGGWGQRGTVLLVVVMIALAIWLRFSRDDATTSQGATPAPQVSSPLPPPPPAETVADAPMPLPPQDGTGKVSQYVPPTWVPGKSKFDVRFVRPDGRPVPDVQIFGATGGVPEAWADDAGGADLPESWGPRMILRWRSGADVLSGRYPDGSPFYVTPFLARSAQRPELKGDFVLAPGRPVTGVVRRKNGSPARSTVVKLYLDYVFVMSAVTDANGAFAFSEVGADAYLIVIGDAPRTILENVRGGVPKVEIVLRADDE